MRKILSVLLLILATQALTSQAQASPNMSILEAAYTVMERNAATTQHPQTEGQLLSTIYQAYESSDEYEEPDLWHLLLEVKAFSILTLFISMQMHQTYDIWYGSDEEYDKNVLIATLTNNIKVLDCALYAEDGAPLMQHIKQYVMCAYEAAATLAEHISLQLRAPFQEPSAGRPTLNPVEGCIFKILRTSHLHNRNSFFAELPINISTLQIMSSLTHKLLLAFFTHKEMFLCYPRAPKNYQEQIDTPQIVPVSCGKKKVAVKLHTTKPWYIAYAHEQMLNRAFEAGKFPGLCYEALVEEVSRLRASTRPGMSADSIIGTCVAKLRRYDYSPQEHAVVVFEPFARD